MKRKASIFLSVTFLLLLVSASDGFAQSPMITGIVPSSGPAAGGTTVTIAGTGFQDGATVGFGGSPSTSVAVRSSTELQAVTPAHAAGTVDITVRNPDLQAATLAGGFTYSSAGLPSPVLAFLGTEDLGSYRYYNLSVTNWQLYPAELFYPAPNLPPCGLNAKSSRTWVDIYDQANHYIYGFCALQDPQDLTQIWFAELKGTAPPAYVYVTLIDRQTPMTYTSNQVAIGYSPIAKALIPSGGTNVYEFNDNLFNYKVTYPALANPPTTEVDLVLQPIPISQADLNALVEGTAFQGVQIVPYDGTGGFGVLFRATCQDSSGNPVACPQTTGPHDIKTSWESEATVSDPAFLMAPTGTHAWQNIFTAYSQTRIDPTGSGRTPPSYSDFVFVQGISGELPTITIATPRDGAVYTLNETVSADYLCSGGFVVSCLGPVPPGNPIDTSSVGDKTFEVNAVVSRGPSADQKVTYHVSQFNTCLLYDPSKPKKSGSTIPVKLQLCDANGNDLSSPNITLHATGLVLESTSVDGVPEDSGNANPDYNFRFDSSLGLTGGYIFNLSTKGLKTGTYSLKFEVSTDTANSYSVPFQVK